MSKMAHTPGPWAHINPDGFTVRHPQVYSDTGPVCNATWLGDGRINELRANVRLIAAAPDLLDACRQFSRALESEDKYEIGNAYRSAWLAIAKATGEES